jgi:hypothetical protein
MRRRRRVAAGGIVVHARKKAANHVSGDHVHAKSCAISRAISHAISHAKDTARKEIVVVVRHPIANIRFLKIIKK